MTEPGHRAARPLRVERVSVRGFRNLEPVAFSPGPQFNVIHGDNGAGKSSLLEALHYLGSLRSFRGGKTDDLIQLGSEDARLEARVSGEAAPRTFAVALSRKAPRRVALDGKRPRTISAWHAAIQVVMFHPGDLILAGGGAEARRAFLDRILEQTEPTYGATLQRYTRALRSRNRLLKSDRPDRRSIRAFDEQLAPLGATIGQSRERVVAHLARRAERAFQDVAGEELPLQVEYRPRVEPEAQVIREALEQSFRKDCGRGFTAEGPHGDDLGLIVRGVAARHHASQGQQRAIVLALKVAELDVLTEQVGRVPLLLLDDVSSELDRSRNRRLFELLQRLGGQVFLTTTHPEFILLRDQRKDWGVEAGRVRTGLDGPSELPSSH